MKKTTLLSFVFLIATCIKLSAQDTIYINYYENKPCIYTEGGKVKGIEMDIISRYIKWYEQKNKTNLVVKYNKFEQFDKFYESVKSGNKKTIGLGTVSINEKRKQELSFSEPYLKNVLVFVTSDKKVYPDYIKTYSLKNAVVVSGSNQMEYLNKINIKKSDVTETNSQRESLEIISQSAENYGYVDIISYWDFVKSNPYKFVKTVKDLSVTDDNFGLIAPKNSVYMDSFNEFMQYGFGFTSTKTYHAILEKYLGEEIIKAVEIE